ncbi:3-ketoacyl-ACP reductase [Actinoplanes sp. SE50]|uniref:3-oxoacyl-ACP reductase n=1 Tax=unclassified Actinoplanes TaxID=2626549 RepID=UPI00023EC327|nr:MULTISPECIES: 3-oxoacyl-ACP reductase [unclassified Actinoplanes]AEV86385.1 3-ketoacyl-(acyl-carrier-protein) reductase [Actinoplanes sp. SE50/110]ATO84782.1 3-ketoacyl-ACP reductase [Actinoplanes sp. SE50]SLM02192.1 beta-oxoacyl-ACP reductase [Actinoplanes sp. SE50/110]
MADRYANFANSGLGRAVVKRLGLPDPPRLRRYRPGDPVASAPVLLGAAPGGRLADPVGKLLQDAGVQVVTEGADGAKHAALIFDATGITTSAGLRALFDYFHPYARSLTPSGRVIVLGTPPEAAADPKEATAQRSLEGLTRSIGKEFGRGSTSQLVYVAPGGEQSVESTLRFLLSGKSAYVSGQVIRIGATAAPTPADWDKPLTGKLALVTGAARGIGASIAATLARDGAEVIALDVPGAGDALADVANRARGRALQLDLTAEDAPARLAGYLAAGPHGGVDILVHNAGITRDKTIARMDESRWDSVIGVNLTAPERVNDLLLERDLIKPGGRIVGVASIAGIAGNRGQTNYATSKAGVIGLVQSTAPLLAGKDITINAVAPGFIETAMTAKMPIGLREAGRRLNSMSQGGLPVDVAETIAWFASPGSAAITGNVVRVCGQSLLGA